MGASAVSASLITQRTLAEVTAVVAPIRDAVTRAKVAILSSLIVWMEYMLLFDLYSLSPLSRIDVLIYCKVNCEVHHAIDHLLAIRETHVLHQRHPKGCRWCRTWANRSNRVVPFKKLVMDPKEAISDNGTDIESKNSVHGYTCD